LKPFLAFLLPLTIYFLVLGLINRRWRPLVVAGPWDFAGVLFAASGFLLFGGPGILSMLNERWRVAWLLNQGQASNLSNEGYYFWLSLSILYFLAVVGGSAYLLWRRRDQLAIYNVEPNVFEEVLAHVLDRLGLSWSRSGQRWYIGFAGSVPSRARSLSAAPNADPVSPAIQPAPNAGTAEAPVAAVEPLGYGGRIELDPSSAMRHVTLYWVQVDSPLRQEIESELRQVLAQVHTRSNPAGGWFLAIAAVLFGMLTLLTIAALILPGLAQG
jgi:hypothetical protein